MSIEGSLTSCNEVAGNTTNTLLPTRQLLIIVMGDESSSMKSFHRLDINFIRLLCKAVENAGGGTLIYYPVGNQTDECGFRCTLLPVPSKSNDDLMMEKQIVQNCKIGKITQQNDDAILKFLNELQFALNDSVLDQSTDLNGCFSKADIVMNEPQYQDFKKFLFVYSDGIQSLKNHRDTHSHYNFKKTDFNLALCGWKTSLPDTMEVILFENPIGYIDYITLLSTFKKD